MTNYTIFNKSNSPLYTQSVNTYLAPAIENTPGGDAAKSGSLYILSTGSVSVGAGNSLLLQIANPSGSGKTIYISNLMGGVTAAGTVAILKNGTITGGTTPTPFNANFASVSTSVTTTKQNTGTLGGTPTSFVNVQVTAGMYLLDFGGGIVVPANQTLSIAVGTGALTASANLTWWEY
ncbi:hypothetical protein D7Z26_24055 [Cohnella endophytica]|uniref:Uncharacterized protein n=1 Tax=Cohnella endophytica TaxID=2419778 RepID=A0A494XGT1_9BACL|nr:hypothetical protein [Cohnella endophytica]RKP47369.1 hypothetical protein D7Z26_24055 [Cohnella endophytica]